MKQNSFGTLILFALLDLKNKIRVQSLFFVHVFDFFSFAFNHNP